MPMMVHLTSAKNIRRILRTGIHKDGRGVYCMPVLQEYYTSHQWLRELRRWHPGPLVAVYFRLDDNEMVECGLYWEAHRVLPAVEAVRWFRQQPDAQGWEIVVPHSIAPRDIHKVRTLSQVLGWRYSPRSHSRPWCNCPVCVSRGEFNSSKKREPRAVFSYLETLATLQQLHAQAEGGSDRKENDQKIVSLLSSLYYRKAGQASDFLFLLDSPSDEVLEALADLLGIYKGRVAKQLLQEVHLRRGESTRMGNEKANRGNTSLPDWSSILGSGQDSQSADLPVRSSSGENQSPGKTV
jgi:hypothetical protein